MGAGIKAQFSDNFPRDIFGVVTGTVGSTQFPNIGCGLARIKAHAGNSGIFTIGSSSGTTASLPWPLSAGDDTGWFAVGNQNFNNYWYKSPSGSMDRISYWLQA
jgi:hypothetical protein